MKEGKFFIDGFKGTFKGIYQPGQYWNGWFNPYFTLNEAKKVLKLQDTKENCLNDGQHFYEFNEDFTALICHYEDGAPGCPQFSCSIEPATIIDGQKYFAIGFFNWVWEKK